MNYLSSKFVTGNGTTLVVLDTDLRVGLGGFIHSNPGSKTASLQVSGADFHGPLGSLAYDDNGGFVRCTKVAHGLAVGDYVFITAAGGAVTGIQKITGVTADTFTTDKTYAAGSPATVYRGQIVFKVASFTEYVLEHLVGPFAAYEVIHHASAGGDTNLFWTYQ